ncbi:MAG TPA: hypothetical protein VN324_09640 [Quisquiliibacterium sp.]|jgi:uncharacterized protein YggT (Ycf19 family)|nr:hypothetical protein [Quisquiliibacterium sp.]
MQLFLALVHELVKFAGLLLIGQGLVFVLSFGRHQTNPVYQFLSFLTSPITRAVRSVTPAKVADRHVPVVAFLLLFWLWFALIFVRRSLILQGAS